MVKFLYGTINFSSTLTLTVIVLITIHTEKKWYYLNYVTIVELWLIEP